MSIITIDELPQIEIKESPYSLDYLLRKASGGLDAKILDQQSGALMEIVLVLGNEIQDLKSRIEKFENLKP